VNVLVTLVVMAAVGAYALAVYRRLLRLRGQVKLAWEKLEADQSNDAIKNVYNRHVKIYNEALAAFPGYLIGPAAGLKPARFF
jgi:hypothetical protein